MDVNGKSGDVTHLFVADSSCVAIIDTSNSGVLIYDPSGEHDNHFHVRIRDPDGAN